MAEEEKKISKFSSGINILQRVDFLWKNCHNYKRNGLYHRWNEELDSVWLELARDLKEEEYYDLDNEGKIILNPSKEDNVKTKGYKSQFDNFEERLESLMPFTDSGMSGFQEPTQAMKDNRNKQYKLLMEKQLFLARLENELGKGTSWEDEDDDF
jgi:hypothetical protein